MPIQTTAQGFRIQGNLTYLLSGEIHYFRVPCGLWRERLRQAKEAGLNAVSTYIAWNYHESKEGGFVFFGDHDLVQFIQTCQDLGLYVILRPGPYICGEWHFGGLPSWLETKAVGLRSSEPEFLRYVERWFRELDRRVAPLQITRGGPVILMQIENEFTYRERHDPRYWQELARMHRENGIDVPLYSCEKSFWLRNGWAAGILPCSDFGANACVNFGRVRAFDQNVPLFDPELYPGWMTEWGNAGGVWPDEARAEEIGWKKALDVARELLEIVAHGGGFNWFMFHGGTNHGFWAGRLLGRRDSFHTTSYDYQALVDEEGRKTLKYYLFQKVHAFIHRHADLLLTAETASEADRAAGIGVRAVVRTAGERAVVYLRNLRAEATVAHTLGRDFPLAPSATALYVLRNGEVEEALDVDKFERTASDPRIVVETQSGFRWERSVPPEASSDCNDAGWMSDNAPRPLAAFGVAQGYGWYRTTIRRATAGTDALGIPDFADRLNVFVNGVAQGAVGAFSARENVIPVEFRAGDNTVAILAEDRGRFCFGERLLTDRKGLLGPAYLGAAETKLNDWRTATNDSAAALLADSTAPWSRLESRAVTYPAREAEDVKRGLLGRSFTAYAAEFTLPERFCLAHLILQGEPDATDIFVNGEPLGVYHGWDDGLYGRFDMTKAARPGRNTLRLRTANKDRKALATRLVSVFSAREPLPAAPWRMRGATDGALDTKPVRWEPLRDGDARAAGPAFFRTAFPLEKPAGLSIVFEGLSQGYMALNGVNLGRFLDIGPQRKLFAPRPWTRAGQNELLVFDEEGRTPEHLRIERLE